MFMIDRITDHIPVQSCKFKAIVNIIPLFIRLLRVYTFSRAESTSCQTDGTQCEETG